MRRTVLTFALFFICTSVLAEDLVFFGNLHSHTSYSDGSGYQSDVYRHTRYSSHLDFLAIEHNHKCAEGFAAPDRKDGLMIANNPRLYHGDDVDGAIDPDALIPTANEGQ